MPAIVEYPERKDARVGQFCVLGVRIDAVQIPQVIEVLEKWSDGGATLQ